MFGCLSTDTTFDLYRHQIVRHVHIYHSWPTGRNNIGFLSSKVAANVSFVSIASDGAPPEMVSSSSKFSKHSSTSLCVGCGGY